MSTEDCKSEVNLLDSKEGTELVQNDDGICEANTEGPCYAPIETMEELLSYGVKRELLDGKELEVEAIPPCTLIERTIPISSEFSGIKIQVNGRRYSKNGCPKTMVCHDFKGGYLDDRFIKGTSNPVNYVFRHWLQIDIFCYFAHKFVTIPPVGWINAAHKHGVQCIGTIITEWTDGKVLCEKLLRDKETMQKAVEKLCLIARHYGFDGYLVNIENEIEKPAEMIEFLRLLTIKMKDVDPNAVVLWYDSVTVEGKLEWQDELNTLNKAFFDVCDGIYLNYNWNDDKLHRSVEEADDREFDIFVGVDVFGRGCFGGGGLNTCSAIEKIASHRLSVAIFAPGWTFECHPYEDFPSVDNEMWNKCAKYFYFRTLHNTDPNEIDCMCNNTPPPLPRYQVLLSTDFNLGFGSSKYHLGKDAIEHGPWFNLNEQSYQPVLNCFRSTETISPSFYASFDSSRGFLGGCSLKVPGISSQHIEQASPLWVPLHVSLRDVVENGAAAKCAAVAVVAWQMSEQGDLDTGAMKENPIKIFFEFMKPSISTRKVIRLSNINEQIVFELPKDPITIQFKDFIPCSEVGQSELIPDISFVFKDVPYAEADLNGWKISCFLMDANHCIDWNITAFRLGATKPVTVGLLSLALLSY